MKDFCIVGAGIGGLTLAYRLQQAGFDVTIVEETDRVGGAIKSIRTDGFLLECGPNSSAPKAGFAELVRELDLSGELLAPSEHAKNRYIAKNFGPTATIEGLKLVKVPHSAGSFLSSELLSSSGKLRLLLEPFSAKITAEDESVRAFLARHLGSEFTDTIVSALLGGIWAADIDQLSCRSALPQIWAAALTRRSLALALREKMKAAPETSSRGTVASFRSGMETVPLALAARMQPGSVILNSRVSSLDLNGPTAKFLLTNQESGAEQRKTSCETSCLILTSPGPVTAELLNDTVPGLTRQIARVPYAPLGVLHLAYRSASITHPLDGFGFLVPPSPRTALIGTIFSSSLFPGRAPEGYHLLTCFTGGAKNPTTADVTKTAVKERVLNELRHLLGTADAPQVLAEHYYQAAVPNYPVGHFRVQRELAEFQSSYPQVRILANWDKGLGVPDRIEEANSLFRQIVAGRKQTPAQSQAILSETRTTVNS